MAYARMASVALLWITIQITIIITFACDWLIFSKESRVTTNMPVYVFVPFPTNMSWRNYWWIHVPVTVLYITVAIGFLYILWAVAQISLPDKIPSNSKKIILIDIIASGLLTISLPVAYGIFVNGFLKSKSRHDHDLGWCFWLAVAGSITSALSTIVSIISLFTQKNSTKN